MNLNLDLIYSLGEFAIAGLFMVWVVWELAKFLFGSEK